MRDIHIASRKGPPPRKWYWPKPASKKYRDGWDRIFKKSKPVKVKK